MVAKRLVTILALSFSLLWHARQLHGAASIDTVQVIVRTSPDKVAEDDYGYSVVLHQVGVPAEGNFEDALDNSRIIVGAPKGTYPGGTALPVSDEPVSMTGLVYTCPVNQGMCSGLLGDSSYPNYQRLFDGARDGDVITGSTPENEYKSGQLMGATLKSSGTHFLACAPRYQTNGTFRLVDNRRPVGRCFISERELRNFTDYRPCQGTNRVIGDVEDSACTAGCGATLFVSNNDRTVAVLGAAGDMLSQGKVFLYDVTNGNNTIVGESVSPNTDNYLYEGYSVASGSITGSDTTDFLVGVPRYDGSRYTGRAYIRNQDSFTNIEATYDDLTGETLGEYYGWSVATADLNGDGFDELLIGAPVYSSPSKPEIGRVYVYRNNRDGTVDVPIHLEGQSPNARFGTSIVNLGDVNGDNFDDVAIGAPYHAGSAGGDNTGAVYIYYGNLNGEIISTTPNQIINASSVVDRVDNLNELRSFGYSLSSGVDVDNNAYNDLLVGAYESKTAVLFRTLSVALVTVSDVSFPDGNTVFIDGSSTGTIDKNLRVCGSYNGRGLEGRALATTLIVREVGALNRLTFGGEREHRREFVFDTTNAEKCEMVTVTIKPLSEQSAGVDVTTPYEVIVEFEQFERPLTPTNGNEELIDLRDVPLLVPIGQTTAALRPVIGCTSGDSPTICESDIQLTFLGLEYRATQTGEPLPDVNSVVAGQVQFVDVRLRYINTGDDLALGTVINFQIPEHFSRQATVRFENPQKENAALCTADGRQFSCKLDSFFPLDQPSIIAVQLSVVQNLVGNEDPVMFSAFLSINSSDAIDTNNEDNTIDPVIIMFSSVADLLVNSLTIMGPMDYGTTLTGEVNSVSNLGRRVILRASVTNIGPSTNPSAQLNISFPVGTSSVGPHFYVFEIRSPDSVVCSPQNFRRNLENLTIPSAGARRRRAAQLTKRQDSQPRKFETNVDCSIKAVRDTDSCANVVCQITDFSVRNFAVDILAVVDRRFFGSQSKTFTYTSYASVKSLTTFIVDPNLVNNIGESDIFELGPMREDGSGDIPVWIPILCAIAALILIIVLFVLLYFFGFFRRKRIREQEPEGEGDVAVTELPPEEKGGAAGASAGAALAPIDEKEDDIDEGLVSEKQDSQDAEVGEASQDDGNADDADESSL